MYFDPHPIVNVGDVVRKTFRWKTKPPREGIECFHPMWMDAPAFILTAPSLFKNVCSNIAVVGVDVLASSDLARKQPQPEDSGQDAGLQLTSSKPVYYDSEFFRLRLKRAQSNHSSLAAAKNCPTLFIWHRDAEGNTRTDEVEDQGLAFTGCTMGFSRRRGDWMSGFELDSGAVTRWGGRGEHELQVFQRLGSPQDREVHLAASNILRVKIADPTTIARSWTRVKGIGANITLDKDIYQLGEDIPLHIAIANFDAQTAVYGANPIWDPCFAISLEVRDSVGNNIPQNERFEPSSMCMGHGQGPMLFEKSKIIPMEWHLGSQGWLPNHPGTYTIVISWNTETGTVAPSLRLADNLKPYATVQATATIHIVGKLPASSHPLHL